jgi:pyridoxamine 5'-phosphate oxidase
MTRSPSNHRAPWRNSLDSHLEQTPGYEFTIATVGHDTQGRVVPRVRTCGYRGFFPELELHPKSQQAMDEQVEDGGNPDVYESDMLSFTTDVRMEKLGQLEESGHAIEAMFWLTDVMAQWRVKGRAYAVGDPQEENEGEQRSRKEAAKGLRVKSKANGDTSKWIWEKAVTKYFANHSPIMRGMFLCYTVRWSVGHIGSFSFSLLSAWQTCIPEDLPFKLVLTMTTGTFRAPPPGQPRSKVPDDPALGLGQKVTDLHDPVARKNFRVVVIQPEEVERLDLSNQEDVRRWKWTLVDDQSGSHWVETELWP